MRKLHNDGISTGEEGLLEDEIFDPSSKDGVEDDKLDISSFSDDEEIDQY
ncbi:MAG: hypothetical protein WC842_01435 [Candidatus Paceibacterota bacterium]|jgi:hypothetical protein